MKIRNQLRKGKWRKSTSILVLLLGMGVTWCAIRSGIESQNLLNGIQRLAFVNMGFVVAAFNLRFKLSDLAHKDYFKVGELENLIDFCSRCSGRLSNLIVFFVITAVLMAIAPLTIANTDVWGGYAMVCFGCMMVGAVQFLYILFSFERLESTSAEYALKSLQNKKAEEIAKKMGL